MTWKMKCAAYSGRPRNSCMRPCVSGYNNRLGQMCTMKVDTTSTITASNTKFTYLWILVKGANNTTNNVQTVKKIQAYASPGVVSNTIITYYYYTYLTTIL